MYVNIEKSQKIYRELWMWNFSGYFHFIIFIFHHFLKTTTYTCFLRRGVDCYSGNEGKLWGRTFGVEGDEGDVVPYVLTSRLSAGGNGVAGLGPALPVLVVAVFLPRHLHHNGVLPTPGNRAERKQKQHQCGESRAADQQRPARVTAVLFSPSLVRD